MSYSITPILSSYEDSKGFRKVMLQIIYNRVKLYGGTIFKLKADQLVNGQVTNHPNKTAITKSLNEQRIKLEKKLLELKGEVTKDKLSTVIKGTGGDVLLEDFITKLRHERTGKYSDGTLRHYKSICNKMLEFKPGMRISDITEDWLIKYEQFLRQKGNMDSTITANVRKISHFLNVALNRKLITEKPTGYKPPKVKERIPEYLSESEIDDIYELLEKVKKPSHQLAGYYFLLSCHAGYRISDLLAFDYKKMVKKDSILLQAEKNDRIISIPIYPRLKRILDKIKNKPLNLSEQKAREYMKEVAKMAGIARKETPHTARHTFAMTLMDRGFSIEDVAALLGDTVKTAKIYARVSNNRIKEEVKKRLG